MNLTVDLQTTTGVPQQVSRLRLFHLPRPSCRFCSNGDGDSLWLMMTITDVVLAQHVIIFLCPISVHSDKMKRTLRLHSQVHKLQDWKQHLVWTAGTCRLLSNCHCFPFPWGFNERIDRFISFFLHADN